MGQDLAEDAGGLKAPIVKRQAVKVRDAARIRIEPVVVLELLCELGDQKRSRVRDEALKAAARRVVERHQSPLTTRSRSTLESSWPRSESVWMSASSSATVPILVGRLMVFRPLSLLPGRISCWRRPLPSFTTLSFISEIVVSMS